MTHVRIEMEKIWIYLLGSLEGNCLIQKLIVLMSGNPWINWKKLLSADRELFPFVVYVYTVKTGVSFRHLLRHRYSASASVISTLKSVCLKVKTTLLSLKTTL
jgi:hypothetical protein